MKKCMLIASLFILSQAAVAAKITEGSYSGPGLWKDTSNKGNYTVQTTVTGDTVSSTYTLPSGTTKTWEFQMKETSNGFFNVVAQGQEIGTGYCLDMMAVCHYEISYNGVHVEETLAAAHGKLYKLGSKSDGTKHVAWEENLLPA